MEMGFIVGGFVFAVILGYAIGYITLKRVFRENITLLRTRLDETFEEKEKLSERLRDGENKLAVSENRCTEIRVRSEMQLKAQEERLSELRLLRSEFETTFKVLSSEALKSNNDQFLKLARERLERLEGNAENELQKKQSALAELVAPLKESLVTIGGKINELEQARAGAYAGLKEQIRNLLETQGRLQSETQNLVNALKAPNVRGRWGEMQLERTVEFAGMQQYVDFNLQVHGQGDDGSTRPDMVVRLPGGKSIIIDAKAPLDAYLKALESDNPVVKASEKNRHAKQIRDHIKKLAAKEYWRQFQPSPEFVVLFLPGEVFYSAALESDPELIQYGAESNVLMATPTTLIALLKATAYGWRQETIAEEARAISDLGKELYERLRIQVGHFNDLGKSLKRAVEQYNRSIRSLETRVLVTARKFENLSTENQKKLPDLENIAEQPIIEENEDLRKN